MTRRKRSPFPTRHDSAAQAEEREARITEMLQRLQRHHDQAEYLQQRARECHQAAQSLGERVRQPKDQGCPTLNRKSH